MTETTKPKPARRFARTPNTDAEPEIEVPAEAEPAVPASPVEPATRPESKTTRIVTLMQREQGATLEELIAATGWLPHTTRAALTGLKKKGHFIQRKVIDGTSHYTITGAA